MGGFAIIAIFIGILTLAGLYFWVRQREALSSMEGADAELSSKVPQAAGAGEAVLVATEHGQVIHLNDTARRWLWMDGGVPDLEFIAELTEPADSFLDLFVSEAQASFQVQGRWVEASSYRVPSADGRRTMIVMRQLTGQGTGENVLDMPMAMSLVNEIGEMVNASMGLELALQVLLEIINQSIPFDAGEICIWDPEERFLQQRGWLGDTRYLLAVAGMGGGYQPGQGVAGWIASNRQPVLVTGAGDAINTQSMMAENPYSSVAAIPLMLGGTFIGTLALFGTEPGRYRQKDIALLQAISKAVATAIYNAMLYAQQEERISDIASLQAIAEQPKGEEGAAPIYRLLNERMAKLLASDMCGVFLYDRDREALAPQLPFHGLPDHVASMLVIPLPRGTAQREIWETQPYWVSNDLVDEPLVEELNLKPLVEVAGIRNTGLFPMQIGGERIGVVAVSNKQSEGGFDPRDIQSMRVLATQAAIVVENVRLYQQERRIDSELVGLQEMTHAIGALSHESEFYSEITERIARLMNSAMCGILLHDPGRHQLVSQPPFYGIDEDLIRDYTIPLPPGSVMAQLWDEEDYWYSNRVQSDTLIYEADLASLAEAADVKRTLIAVMNAGGRRIGVVQVSNKLNDTDFTDSDARLLQIFATQAAAIIENARLYHEVQMRAEQAERLRRIAERASTMVSTDDTFKPVLQEIADFMESPIAFVNVIDQTTNCLITYPRWSYGAHRDLTEPLIVDLNSPGFEHSVALSGRPFFSNDLQNDGRVLPGYRMSIEMQGLTSTVMVPLIVGDRHLGELGVANREQRPYSQEDVRSLSTVAAQVAASLERVLLYEATGENLRRRLEELDSVARVSNELTVTVDLDRVLEVIRQEAESATRADGSTVALLPAPPAMDDGEGRALVPMQLERRIGDIEGLGGKLADVERQTIQRATAVLVMDYASREDIAPAPAQARSAAAAAILYLDRVVGVIHVYHHDPNRFDERAAGFLTTLSTKASLGYQNAVYYQQQMERGQRLRQRVDQLNRIFELGQMIQTNTDPELVLEAIAYSVQQSVGYDTVLMMLVDEEAQVLRRVAHAGLPLDTFEQTRADVLPLDRLDEFLQEEYRSSESYFFPVEEVQQWYIAGIEALSTSFEDNRSLHPTGPDAWRDGDKLLVKISGQGGELLGLMVLDRPYDNRRPERGALEVLEIFAHQASTLLENTRLFRESRRSAEQEALLNEITKSITATSLDVNDIARAVAEGVQKMGRFSRITLALAGGDHTADGVTAAEEEGFYVLQAVVQSDGWLQMAGEQRRNLDGTVLGRAIEEQQEHIYRADSTAAAYEDLRTWQQDGERSSFVTPLIAGGECLGAFHIGSDEPGGVTSSEVRQLLSRISQMVSSAIQNAQLFNQAVNLQVLNRSVVESIQQGIVVLDNSGRVININDFMRRRYGWTDEALRRDLFAYRPQFAEFLETDLRQVLETGEPRERINQTAPRLDGTSVVRNFYMYPLRSGDTIRGAVLLVEDISERAQLEAAIEARANQLAALTEVSTRITASLEREEVLQIAMDEMGWIIPFDTMTIWRRNGSLMVLEAHSGLDDSLSEERVEVSIGDDGRVQQLVESQRAISLRYDEPIAPAVLPGDDGCRSWLGVPLVNQGHVVGMMVLTRTTADAFDARQEQHVAFAFASQVAIALANADLFEQAFERTSELGTVLEAAQATSLTRDLGQVFRIVAQLMFSALDMQACTILIWDEIENALEVQFSDSRDEDSSQDVPVGARYNLSEYPARLRALRDREVVAIVDIGADTGEQSLYPNELEELRAAGRGARLLVPLVIGDEAIGLIQLEQISGGERAVSQQQVRLARALGAQVAIAIENARLSTETASRLEELLTINQLSQAITSTLKLEDMLPIIREQLPMVTGAEEMYLALYDAETERITFPLAVRDGQDFQIPPRQLGTDEVSYIIRRRHTLSLEADYFSIDELRRIMRITNGEGDIKSYMGVPLIAGDNVLGVLAIRSMRRTRAFDVNDDRILSTVGSQLGAAIQNARLFEQIVNYADNLNRLVEERTDELEAERDRLDTLYQITSELARTLDMEQLLERALSMVSKAVGGTDGVILLSDHTTDQLFSRAWLRPENLTMPDGSAVPEDFYYEESAANPIHPAAGLAQWLLHNEDESEHVVVVDDLSKTTYWDEEATRRTGLCSALAVMLENNDEPIGVMVLLSDRVGAFTENHLKLLVPAANQVAASINSADLYMLIRDQAERVGRLLRAEQEEAQKNSAILESITDGVMLADHTGQIILFNSAAERLLQIPREQAIGQPVSWLAGLYKTSASRWSQLIREWANRLNSPEQPVEYVAERIEIGDYIITTHLSPVYIGDMFLGTVSVFRDVTRDVQAERAKSEFIENVSHEFRTPLTPIKGYTDLLLIGAGGDLSEMQTNMIRTIKENVDRLTVLVNDVLNIAKLDRDDVVIAYQQVNLRELLPDVLHQVAEKPQNQHKDMNTSVTVADDVPLIPADRVRLAQIMTNLIDNAFNYTLPGGKVTVHAMLEPERDSVLISVADTGVGIPEEFKESAWQRFQRYEEHALHLEVAGTGLGLPLVRELVTLHQGRVWFESREGEGTTFYVRLPLHPASQVTEPVRLSRIDTGTMGD